MADDFREALHRQRFEDGVVLRRARVADEATHLRKRARSECTKDTTPVGDQQRCRLTRAVRRRPVLPEHRDAVHCACLRRERDEAPVSASAHGSLRQLVRPLCEIIGEVGASLARAEVPQRLLKALTRHLRHWHAALIGKEVHVLRDATESLLHAMLVVSGMRCAHK